MSITPRGLEDLQRNWNAFGERDPMWAILTDDGKRGGRWREHEFFATGRSLVAETLAELDALGVTVPRRVALDFGCGVGRLTQALAEHFEHVHGVDIARSMIEGARAYNRHGRRVTYHVNDTKQLAMLPSASVDFVLAIIVLQHMAPAIALDYLREFLRVLSADGVAFFQVPYAERRTEEHALWLRAKVAIARSFPRLYRAYQVRRYLMRLRGPTPAAATGIEPVMEMHTIPVAKMMRAVEEYGGRVVAVRPDEYCGPQFKSVHYIVTRVGAAKRELAAAPAHR